MAPLRREVELPLTRLPAVERAVVFAIVVAIAIAVASTCTFELRSIIAPICRDSDAIHVLEAPAAVGGWPMLHSRSGLATCEFEARPTTSEPEVIRWRR